MLKIAIIGCMLAGCTPPPRAQVQAPQQSENKSACQAGSNAKGIAAGFFSLFTDDLDGCL